MARVENILITSDCDISKILAKKLEEQVEKNNSWEPLEHPKRLHLRTVLIGISRTFGVKVSRKNFACTPMKNSKILVHSIHQRERD